MTDDTIDLLTPPAVELARPVAKGDARWWRDVPLGRRDVRVLLPPLDDRQPGEGVDRDAVGGVVLGLGVLAVVSRLLLDSPGSGPERVGTAGGDIPTESNTPMPGASASRRDR